MLCDRPRFSAGASLHSPPLGGTVMTAGDPVVVIGEDLPLPRAGLRACSL